MRTVYTSTGSNNTPHQLIAAAQIHTKSSPNWVHTMMMW